jgi:hypothetical protein
VTVLNKLPRLSAGLGQAHRKQDPGSRRDQGHQCHCPRPQRLRHRRSRLSHGGSASSRCRRSLDRAGSPWNATRRPARRIHRQRCSLFGKVSSTARSVRAMSPGSPESAAQRNGPWPSSSWQASKSDSPGN